MINIFDEKEFLRLKTQYGNSAEQKDILLRIENKQFFEERKDHVENDRRGEVAFAVERANGKIIVVRTSFYPDGIYRIPTGHIEQGEDIVEALMREVKEELGLTVQIKRFLGVLKVNMVHKQQAVDFYSYIFWLKEMGGNILKDALEDEISEYKEVNREQLNTVVDNLINYGGSWKDWCFFRAQTTGFVLRYI